MPTSTDDDPIAEAILSGEPERQVQYEGWALFGRYSLPTKLRGIGAMSAATAVTLFLTVTARRAALESVLQTAPLSATVAATVVLMTGLKFLTIGSGIISLVGVVRRRDEHRRPDPERLFGLEETGTFIGFAIGGLGVLIGICLLAVLALAGAQSAPGFVARLADPVHIPVTYGTLLVWSALLACMVFAGSVIFEAQR